MCGTRQKDEINTGRKNKKMFEFYQEEKEEEQWMEKQKKDCEPTTNRGRERNTRREEVQRQRMDRNSR